MTKKKVSSKTETTTKIPSAKKFAILKRAFELFYERGVHATGVDTIIEGSGISKRTLYKHFGSKEELIKATLNHYHENAFTAITEFINKKPAKSPDEKVLRLFDYLAVVIDSGDMKGCYAMSTKSEYANRDEVLESVCDNHTDTIERLVETLLKEAKISDAKKISTQVMMLFKGSILSGQSKKSSAPILLARSAAKLLIDSSK